MPGLRGVRARIAVALVALVALTAAVLGIGAYVFVDTRLHQQALADAASQAGFDLSVTVPERQLPPDATSDDVARSGLAETFQRREAASIIDLGGGPEDVVFSDSGLRELYGRLPPDVVQAIDDGQIGYFWTDVVGVPSLVVGGRAADDGPIVYFVRDVSQINEALEQLRSALAGGAVLLIVLALLAARLIARGILAPVEAAGRAAERIERGDLSARVPVTSRDEFGTWAERFNRMADALADTIGRLEVAQAQNRRFVSDVSHELRTPLAALVAEASIVAEHLDELPPESRRAAEMLVGDVGRLRSLVEELMELSRFDADAEQVQVESVDLVKLIRTVVAARLPTARFQPPARPVVIDSDPRRLDRILGNFLDNAREHAGGADVEIELVARPEAIVIAVSDRGPGVPPDRLERIFERFTKLDASRHGGSSGLGLAIAAEHAALLGGSIRAKNRDGGGLRLELELPLAVTGSLRPGDETAMPGLDDQAPTSTTKESI